MAGMAMSIVSPLKRLAGSAPRSRVWFARLRRRMIRAVFDHTGAAAVEFAMVMPLLLALLLGIMQWGYVFFVQINMTNAAREGARELAVGSATIAGVSSCSAAASGTAEYVACDILAGLPSTSFSVTACDPDNADATLCPGADDVAVQVTLPKSQIVIADPFDIFDSTGNMVALVRMRKED